MARPKGQPKIAGRKKGVPNKATRELKDICQQYTDEAVNRLVDIMRNGRDEVSVSAIKELFDRAYGKAKQQIDASVDASLTVNVLRFTDASN